MKRTNILVVTAVALLAIGCSNKQSNTTADSTDSTTMEVVTDNGFYGTYEGVLPCADCPGIKTTLTINEDNTYDLKSEYLDKKEGVFEKSGVYNIVHNGAVIELVTPSSGDKTYYKILEKAVALTDTSGVLNEGELAEHYILKRK